MSRLRSATDYQRYEAATDDEANENDYRTQRLRPRRRELLPPEQRLSPGKHLNKNEGDDGAYRAVSDGGPN